MTSEPRSAPALVPELRRLVPPVYFPWAMPFLGMGITLPVLPLHLEDSGLSLSTVGLVVGATGVGSALGGVPASAFGDRWGNDRLMFTAVALQAATLAAFGLTDLAIVLLVLRAALGVGMAGAGLSRQVYISRSVDIGVRGRVMALVGGNHRLTLVVGPLLGGWVYEEWGGEAVFVLAGAVTALGLLWIVLPGGADPHDGPDQRESNGAVGPVLWHHRRLLARAALGPMLVMAARDGRYVVVPLIGDRLELSGTEIGALVAVGTAADFLLFPVSGFVMDRFGRLFSMVPAFSLMAGGLVLLAVADTGAQAVVAGVVMGIGNGLSSGAMLTMASDLAPADGRGPFIAGFNMASGVGHLLGPIIVGWAADAIGLGASAVALAVALAIGLVWIVVMIGETGPGGRHRERRHGKGGPRAPRSRRADRPVHAKMEEC